MKRLFDEERKWWWPISHFAGHIVIGSLLFCILAAPAVGLSLLVKSLQPIGVSKFTIDVLELLEHTILVGDSALFVVYALITGFRFMKEIAE